VVRNGVTSNYSYISNDRFTSGDGFTFSSYDNNGSPTSVTGGGVTTTFTYDRDNRVSIAAYSTGGSDSFVYDGEGKRIQRTAGGSTTTFVYDGATLIGEIVGSASTYHIPGVSYTDSAGARRWYRDNHLGSYVQATNSAGNIVTELEYDAFGQEELLAGSMIANHRFAGKHGYYKDSTSGLMLLGARYYAAKLGRFINQDPIGHSGGLNLYLYCHANPVNEIDPDGTDGFTDFVAGWGDTLSFGATKIARKKLGEFLGIGDANEAVNYDSGYYKGGQAVGVTHSLAFGGVGAAKAFAGQGAKVAANYAQVLQATKLKGLTGIIEKHHLLPTQFLKEFKRVGLNIDDYLKPLDRAIHKLIHGKGGGQLNQLSWNKNWEAFFQRNPQATAKQILKFKDEMVKKFKL
jgi:RHS repeat-associated protein